jgi:hypothetical protein
MCGVKPNSFTPITSPLMQVRAVAVRVLEILRRMMMWALYLLIGTLVLALVAFVGNCAFNWYVGNN